MREWNIFLQINCTEEEKKLDSVIRQNPPRARLTASRRRRSCSLLRAISLSLSTEAWALLGGGGGAGGSSTWSSGGRGASGTSSEGRSETSSLGWAGGSILCGTARLKERSKHNHGETPQYDGGVDSRGSVQMSRFYLKGLPGPVGSLPVVGRVLLNLFEGFFLLHGNLAELLKALLGSL